MAFYWQWKISFITLKEINQKNQSRKIAAKEKQKQEEREKGPIFIRNPIAENPFVKSSRNGKQNNRNTDLPTQMGSSSNFL